jgi:hypothetical protein
MCPRSQESSPSKAHYMCGHCDGKGGPGRLLRTLFIPPLPPCLRMSGSTQSKWEGAKGSGRSSLVYTSLEQMEVSSGRGRCLKLSLTLMKGLGEDGCPLSPLTEGPPALPLAEPLHCLPFAWDRYPQFSFLGPFPPPLKHPPWIGSPLSSTQGYPAACGDGGKVLQGRPFPAKQPLSSGAHLLYKVLSSERGSKNPGSREDSFLGGRCWGPAPPHCFP